MLNNDHCPTIMVWGIKDNDSWRSASNPLLYTSGLGKKPAWYAVRSALRHRTLTDGSSTMISSSIADTPSSDSPIYDLSGRRVNPANIRSGLYIKNGKKVIFK